MQKIHNYLLERQLCENEFVTVHIAVDTVSQKRFTLSIVNDDYQINPVFLMKVITGTSQHPFTHPHIAKIIDYGEVNHKQYFVSEYLGHRTLASFLDKPVPATFALDVISQLASGLHYISMQGYIHGHIRPDNVLFDQYGNVILSTTLLISNKKIDHKSSKEFASRYLSPEVIAGDNANECSDLYSLGVMLFELLTGEHFGERESSIVSNVENVNELIPYLPSDYFGFQPIINKLLAKNPRQRFQTGLALVDALNDYESKLVDQSIIDSSLDFYETESGFQVEEVDGEPVNSGRNRYKRLLPDMWVAEPDNSVKRIFLNFVEKTLLAIQLQSTKNKSLVVVFVFSILTISISFFTSGVKETSTATEVNELVVTTEKDSRLKTSNNELAGNKLFVESGEELALELAKVKKISADNFAKLKLAKVPPLISELDIKFAKRTALTQEKNVNKLLKRAIRYQFDLQFTTPVKENAYAMYIAVLNIDPDNSQALEGIFNIAEGYAYMAKVQIDKRNYSTARQYINKGLKIQGGNTWLLALKTKNDNRIGNFAEKRSAAILESLVLDQ